MENQKDFKQVLKSLDEAKQLLVVGVEKGKLSSLERDLILEKLRKSYERLIFGSGIEPQKSSSIQDFDQKTKKVEVEIVPEVPKPSKEPEVKAEEKSKDQVPYAKEESFSQELESQEKSSEIIEFDNKLPEESITDNNQSFSEIEAPTEEEENDPTADQEDELPLGKTPTTVLGEKYQGRKKFRNETLSQGKKDVASKLQNKPIFDLTKAVGINDKFMFTKELFNGNAELYAKTMRTLNEYTDINDALIYVQNNFNWDDKNEAASQLIDLVRRKLMMG